MTVIEVVFDGKTFIPVEPVEIAPGTRLTVTISPALSRPPADEHELPWATAEDAIGYSRARPGYHLFPGPEKTAEEKP